MPESVYWWTKENGLHIQSILPYRASTGFCDSTKPGQKYTFDTIGKSDFIQFSLNLAQKVANKGTISVGSVKAEGKFRYLCSSKDAYDAKTSGECDIGISHSIGIWKVDSGILTIINSWDTTWGKDGMKQIKPCSSDVL